MSESSNTSVPIDFKSTSQSTIITRKQKTQIDSESLLHELANLVDACLRNVQLVIRQIDDPRRVPPETVPQELLERLRVALAGLTQMAGLMQRWSCSPDHNTGLFDQDQSIHDTAQQAVRLLAPIAMARGVTLHVDLPTDLSNRAAGPLFPVLFNAIRNSIEAIAAQRQGDPASPDATAASVRVGGRASQDHVVLTVTDNGPGIDDDVLGPNGNAVIGVTTKPDGHALGLALCRDVVESLGGTIALRNHSPTGAQLTITLPAEPPPE